MTDSKAENRDTTRHGVCRPGDARHGDWSRDRLRTMDEKFCKRVERAVRDRREHLPNEAAKPR
jgi:hypothetical protein